MIIPISFYLLWQKRQHLRAVALRPAWGGLVVIAASSLLWTVARFAALQELAQFAAIFMLQGMVIAALGWRFYAQAPIALLYWLLLVPSGEPLLPLLQALTSRLAASLIELLGISVFRDGISIEVPGGHYLVAPGCAGLNFLLAGLAIALAFAELSFAAFSRKLAFVAAMLVTALIGNALRVGLIIAIAEATGNIGNIADDHLLYGWLLFTLLMFAVLAIGNRFQQPLPPPPPAAIAAEATPWPCRLIPLGLAAIPFATQLALPAQDRLIRQPRLECGALLPAPPTGPPLDWPTDQVASIACSSSKGRLEVAVALIDRPIRDSKLITWTNMWREDGESALTSRRETMISVAGQDLPARLESWSRDGKTYSAWTLIWSEGDWRRPGWPAAWADLRSDLRGHRHSALLRLTVSAEPDDGESVVRDFLAAASPAAMIGV